MKRICVWIFVSPFIISCSGAPDEDNTVKSAVKDNDSFNRQAGGYPDNQANQYDMAGQLYVKLLDSYFKTHPDGGNKSKSFLEIESMAYADEDFKKLGDNSYIPVNQERIEYIVNGREAVLCNVICNSKLSAEAKISLYGFALTALIYQSTGPDYDAMYKYILEYEGTIEANETFTADDKRIMLTTTSIVRHSTARKRPKKNTDRDWELLVVSIAAGTEGGMERVQNAIIMSVAATVLAE